MPTLSDGWAARAGRVSFSTFTSVPWGSTGAPSRPVVVELDFGHVDDAAGAEDDVSKDAAQKGLVGVLDEDVLVVRHALIGIEEPLASEEAQASADVLADRFQADE